MVICVAIRGTLKRPMRVPLVNYYSDPKLLVNYYSDPKLTNLVNYYSDPKLTTPTYGWAD